MDQIYAPVESLGTGPGGGRLAYRCSELAALAFARVARCARSVCR
jgi:hypothetical protein